MKELRKLMAEAGVNSLADLARRSGLSYQSIHRFATTNESVKLETCEKVARALGVATLIVVELKVEEEK